MTPGYRNSRTTFRMARDHELTWKLESEVVGLARLHCESGRCCGLKNVWVDLLGTIEVSMKSHTR